MDFRAASDAIPLARLQFAFTITFHIVFPTFTIGLSGFIATLQPVISGLNSAWLAFAVP
jgi:cytochrome d ubiquinol oxidase subunit I